MLRKTFGPTPRTSDDGPSSRTICNHHVSTSVSLSWIIQNSLEMTESEKKDEVDPRQCTLRCSKLVFAQLLGVIDKLILLKGQLYTMAQGRHIWVRNERLARVASVRATVDARHSNYTVRCTEKMTQIGGVGHRAAHAGV
jgi:hypothetical protein